MLLNRKTLEINKLVILKKVINNYQRIFDF